MSERKETAWKAYDEAMAQAGMAYKEAMAQAEKVYREVVAQIRKEAEAQAKRGTKDSG